MAFNPVWANQVEIDTGSGSYAKLCAGIESMTFNPNEQIQQYFFLCGEGFANNETTGAAPELVISGRRVVGDAAQDFIAGKQFALGTDRNSVIKVTAEGKLITCGCTIANVTSFGGNTLDVNSFGCTIRFNGEPTMTTTT